MLESHGMDGGEGKGAIRSETTTTAAADRPQAWQRSKRNWGEPQMRGATLHGNFPHWPFENRLAVAGPPVFS